MKVFLINLDRDRDRLAVVDAQLRRLGVDYERVSAVSGCDIDLKERHRVENRFRSWCAYGQNLTDGEIGCALSHQTVYRMMLDAGFPYACVLEDDVVLDDRFKTVLKKVEREIKPENPQVLLLSNHNEMFVGDGGSSHAGYVSAQGVEFNIKRIRTDYYTEGYVVTAAAAREILTANYPLVVPADHWGRWRRQRVIELFHVFPSVCSQAKEAFKSGTVTGSVKLVKDMPLFRWCWRKLNRVVGVTLDRILR